MMHAPAPLQFEAPVTMSPVQLCGLHMVVAPGSPLHAVRSLPLHAVPLHTSPPPASQVARPPWGKPLTAPQVPLPDARSQASH